VEGGRKGGGRGRVERAFFEGACVGRHRSSPQPIPWLSTALLFFFCGNENVFSSSVAAKKRNRGDARDTLRHATTAQNTRGLLLPTNEHKGQGADDSRKLHAGRIEHQKRQYKSPSTPRVITRALMVEYPARPVACQHGWSREWEGRMDTHARSLSLSLSFSLSFSLSIRSGTHTRARTRTHAHARTHAHVRTGTHAHARTHTLAHA
jgi:hypothetical protein